MMFGHILYFVMSNGPVAIINVLNVANLETEFQLTFSLLNFRPFPVTYTSLVKAVPVSNITEIYSLMLAMHMPVI